VVLDATASAAGRARRARGQERGDLTTEDLALQFQQEGLGLGERQAHLLRPLVVLAQHDEVLDGYLLVIIGDGHELDFELQRHTDGPQRRKGPATS
jgi:hypothetical protein